MAFSYSFNTGRVSSFYDAEYLKKAMGFSTNATDLAISGGYFNDISKLDIEYEAKFGQTLAISDNYKYFSDGTMSKLLNNDVTNITCNANSPESRTDIYKEMFLESFKNVYGTTSIAVDHSATNYNGSYKFDGTTLAATGASSNKAQLVALKQQLETEATKLKAGLNSTTLAYGGYPEIGYSSVDAEIALLDRQLESATQAFYKDYDDMYGYYRIKAGGHKYDNDDDCNEDIEIKEREAGSAAMMAACLALKYAQETYGQTIKPTAADYVFGSAPLIFKNQADVSKPYTTGYIVNGTQVNEASGTPVTGSYQYTTVDDGKTFNSVTATATEDYFYDNLWHAGKPETNNSTGPAQDAAFVSLIKEYTSTPESLLNNSLKDNRSGYQMLNRRYVTGDDYLFNMNDFSKTLDEQTGEDGSELKTLPLDELGDNIPKYIDWMVRDSMGVGGVTKDVKNTTYCREDALFVAKDLFASAQKLVDLKMKIQIKTIESSINNQARAEYEARVGAVKAIDKVLSECTGTDPYTININGQDYMMGEDSNKDGTISDMTEILGIKDSQENIFESLKNLDENKDGYVSQEELTAHNIILNALDKQSGQLKKTGFDMSQVIGINLAELQNADGTNNVFGKFTMDLQDKKVNGNLTFEDSSYFNKLFASNVNVSSLSSSVAATSSPIVAKSVPVVTPVTIAEEATPVAEEPAATETNVETSASEAKTYSMFDAKNFSFDFVAAEDNKSAFEKLLDQLSWQMNISNLTSTQRYNILDSIDANEDIAIAESEIQQELEKINLSA